MPTVLVNADDFGLHRDIDRGILDCIDAGVVQSISFSPQGQSLNWNTLNDLRRRGVRVGLHITLVGEAWLSDGRIFESWKDLIKQLAPPTQAALALRVAVEREINMQVQRAIERNIQLSHIDSHQHVHAFSGIWQPVLAAAQQHGIPRVRVPWCPSWRIVKRTVGGAALQYLSARLGKRVGRFLPIIGIAHAGQNTLAIYRHELKRARSVDVELCAHPGIATPALQMKYAAWNFDWQSERTSLLDPKFRQAVTDLGYNFAPMLPELSMSAA